MKLKKRLKGLFKKDYKQLFINNKPIAIISIPFILMFLYILFLGIGINYYSFNVLTPFIFSFFWILLFIGVSINLKYGKVLYLSLGIVFSILFIINGVYFSMTKSFFDFSLLESASEGSPYIIDALKNCDPLVYLAFISIVVSILIGLRFYPKKRKTNIYRVAIVIIIFILGRSLTPLTLGKANTELTWSSWRNARNIYNAYNDTNKSIKVSGFFEYSVRNYYVTFLKSEEKESEENIEFLNVAFEEDVAPKNKHTGILEGKNLIIIQTEGMDDWLIDEETTPTLYKMKTEGINFANHYSYYNGGGSTFNSEFAINTGFITPLSYTKNAYSFNKNSFPYSLANLFKERNYTVNAFHMNTGEYYSRTVNYLNWGYDAYYGLKDLGEYTDSSYELDRELMLNETFDKLMFPEGSLFVDYIIAYSGHLPFTNTKGVCKMLYDLDNNEYDEEGNLIEKEFTLMSEEECIRRQNKETDYMVSLLLQKLEEKNLLNNTVIVVVTDHYLYTIEDQTILEKYKETSNNLINKTPFFIWYKGVKKEEVKEVTSQLNVLPTLLNLYGIPYSTNNYIGKDALQSNYKGIVFFSDYSWYDGNVYVDGGVVTYGKRISEEDLEDKNYLISYLTKKNDLALKNNYFNK